MKFLTAATLLCFALVGQSQAGSLRGLAVPVPHQIYGVPVLDNEIHIEETQPIVEDRDSVSVDLETHEEAKVSQPSTEYGAPTVAHEIKAVPFVDTLPLVDSIVSFGTPPETYGPPAQPTTPKPELPYLKPGLPTLPEAPFVPEVPEVKEKYVEVSNEYLPPVGGTPSVVEEYVPSTHEAPLVASEGTPSEIYGLPAKPTTPKPELPHLEPGLPTLPEAPVVPEVREKYVEVSNEYLPSIGGTPSVVEEYVPSTHEAPLVGLEGRPIEIYGPPAHEEHKPSGLSGAANVPVHIPKLPKASVTTFAAENARPSEINGHQPEMPEYIAPAVTKDQTVPVEATKEYFYEPPTVAFPTPISVQPIFPEIKTLPAEAPRKYFYEVPAKAFPTPVIAPVGHGIVSHSGFVQSSASSSSSSSNLHVSKYAVPLTIQPHAESVIFEELKPIGQGFAIHSVAGSLEKSSTGLYNQVSVVNHLLPNLPSFGTVVEHHQPVANSLPVPVPHGAYSVANF